MRWVAILMFVLLWGCTRTVYRPYPVKEVVREHDEHKSHVTDISESTTKETDKEHVKESTTVTVNDAGDTLRTDTRIIYLRDRSLERENSRLLAIIDSLRSARQDSIPVPYPVETVKEVNRLHWWQTALMWAGVAGVIILAIKIKGLWKR